MANFNEGTINSYTFPLLGNEILVAPVDSALPIPYVPITSTNIPSGWTKLGPIRDNQATITGDINSEELVTGLTPTAQREVITGQSATVEAFLQRFEPGLLQQAYNPGIANRLTAAGSASRAFTDMWLFGTFGTRFALLVTGDPDIDLTVDDGSETFEQLWQYTPRAQRIGQISLSERNKRAPEIVFRAKLIGYSNPGAPNRTVLMQLRFLNR